eukprot:356890-Chlamydomonas_euryale.AAC.5
MQQQQQQLHAAAKKASSDPAVEKAICDAFDDFDADRSGNIAAFEIKSMLAKMGQTNISDAHVAEMLVAMGAVVTLEQFEWMYYARQGSCAPGSRDAAALLQAFNEFDIDGTCTLTAAEVKSMVSKMGQALSDAQMAYMLVSMGAQVTFGSFAEVDTKQQQEQRHRPQHQHQQHVATKLDRDPAIERSLRQAFDEFDVDRSGITSASEFKRI